MVSKELITFLFNQNPLENATSERFDCEYIDECAKEARNTIKERLDLKEPPYYDGITLDDSSINKFIDKAIEVTSDLFESILYLKQNHCFDKGYEELAGKLVRRRSDVVAYHYIAMTKEDKMWDDIETIYAGMGDNAVMFGDRIIRMKKLLNLDSVQLIIEKEFALICESVFLFILFDEALQYWV